MPEISFCPDVARSTRIASHRVLVPSRTWTKAVPRIAADLSDPSHGFAGLAGDGFSHEVSLSRLRDALLVWSHFFIVDGEVHGTCPGLEPHEVADLAGPHAGTIAGRSSGFHRKGDAWHVADAKAAEAVPVPGRTMFATSPEPHNWGLWLLRSVPAILHFLDNRRDFDRLFVHAGHENMRALLGLIGVPAGDVVFHDPLRSFRFEEVQVIRYSKNDFFVSEESRAIFRWLRRKALARSGGGARGRIYLSRRLQAAASGGYRALVNEAELEDLLAERGFAILTPERMPVAQQIAAISSASELVGTGGAGMFNAVFCPPGTRVLDIESTRLFLHQHTNIFASCGHEFGVLVGEGDMGDPRPVHRRWSLDLRRAAPLIDAFLSLR